MSRYAVRLSRVVFYATAECEQCGRSWDKSAQRGAASVRSSARSHAGTTGHTVRVEVTHVRRVLGSEPDIK